MRKLSTFIFCLICVFCCKQPNNIEEPQKPIEEIFALGADISWVTEMEANGHKFYNSKGEQRDCFVLMKELGLNAIRLRVWVDPNDHNNWCNTEDLVAKARRAKDLGLDVMIDFHYSDWWADPSQQYKPKSWEGLNIKDLENALVNHTKSVLKALKDAGVYPKWVQVGNEITSGMLWDTNKEISAATWDVSQNGKTYPKNWANLGKLVSAGYDAVKSIFADAIVIVHIDNGFKSDTINWFYDELKKNGGKWDMIGLSVYPYWAMLNNEGYTSDRTISESINNIKTISSKYACDVMIVETGVECADDKGKLASEEILNEGYLQLKRIINESITKTNGKCKGVFYWEPECKPSVYRLGAFTEDGRPTKIMDAFK